MVALLFSPCPRHPVFAGPFPWCALGGGTVVSPAQKELAMRKVRLLLRSAPSRIGRRLALIAAIAAASLPSAGVLAGVSR